MTPISSGTSRRKKMFCQHIKESVGPEACADWGSFRDRITSAAHDTISVVAPGNVGKVFLPVFLTSSVDSAFLAFKG